MKILVDTNVFIDQLSAGPRREVADRAMATWTARGDVFVTAPQILGEFWVVATRPVSANGLGLAPDAVGPVVREFLITMPLLHEDLAAIQLWLSLVEHGVRGKRAHDARLAALVLAGHADAILTSNVADFADFPVRTLHPRDAALA